jgi:hypothetical protein
MTEDRTGSWNKDKTMTWNWNVIETLRKTGFETSNTYKNCEH